jgi:hypothetical protein
MNGSKTLAIDRRRAAILDRLMEQDGEVWAGDFAALADLEKWRPAFESLVKEGVLTRRVDKRTRRLYYGLRLAEPN